MRIESEVLGRGRHLLVYSPAGLAEATLPLVLFNDGKAYFGWGRAPQVMDRLLARGEIEPAHLVFVPPGERTKEYAFNPDYRAFLTDELLPAVEARIRCDGRRTVWGASLGGLLGATLALERPDLFGCAVTQSGAYLFSPDMDLGNPFAGNESFREDLRRGEPRRVRWHLDCGTLEWLLASNERVAAALREAGADATFTVRNAGHNWINWRNGLADGFRRALPAGLR
jgi:enterochelin esterase family protein